jgi:p-aminobenzoyl-glutamate transporter AbgT
MLIVLMILTICAVVISAITYPDNDWDISGKFVVSTIGAIGLGIADFIVIITIIAYYSTGIVANPKIEMYQEENQKIEEQIDTLVKQYMEYEGKTLTEFKSESSITLVSLYPELKSDDLVSKQIEVYIENNNKIKQLKEDKINMKIGKWLLYFGK